MELGELSERSEALVSDQLARGVRIDGIPHLRRALVQIESDTEKVLLARGAAARSATTEARAVRLLAEHGFEASALLRRFQRATWLDAFPESDDTVAFDDLPHFMEHQFEETLRRTARGTEHVAEHFFRTAFADQVATELTTARENLCMELRTSASYGLPDQLFQGGGGGGGGFGMDQFHFDRGLFACVYRALLGGTPEHGDEGSLADSLATQVQSAAVPSRDPHLPACYEAVQCFGRRSVPERWTGEEVVATARRCLEDQFARSLQREYGPVGDSCSAVLRFLRAGRSVDGRRLSDPPGSGVPTWPHVFYLLRCGLLEDALDVLPDSEPETARFRALLEVYLDHDRRLPDSALPSLAREYSLVVRRGGDAHHRACYVVLAGDQELELGDTAFELLFVTIEDYLWLKICCVHETRRRGAESREGSEDAYRLKDLQQEILSRGAHYFDTDRDRPSLFAFVLLISGQFSRAIEELAKSGADLATHAVHLGLVLHQCGLLGGDEGTGGSASEIDPGRFDFELFLSHYVGTFALAHADEAVVYLFSLRTRTKRNEFLLKLLVDVKEVERYLGSVDSHGKRLRPGLFEQLSEVVDLEPGSRVNVEQMAQDAGRSLAEQGDLYTALALFIIAGDHDAALELLVPHCSAELFSRSSFARERALRSSRRFLEDRREATLGSSTGRSAKMVRSLEALVTMAEFLDLWWAEKLEEAWDVVVAMRIVPIDEEEISPRLQDLSKERSARFDRAVTGLGEDLFMAVLDVLSRLSVALQSDVRRRSSDTGREGRLQELERAGSTLIAFAGLMQYDRPEITKTALALGLSTAEARR